MNKNIMTRKDSIILVNFMFYLFTITFVFAILLYFALLGSGYHILYSFIFSLAVGVSLPASLFVLCTILYSLVASKVRALFRKHPLPLIGLEKSSLSIVNAQTKFFILFRDASIVTVIFYILSILPMRNSNGSIYILLKMILFSAILFLIGVMAIDGIYIYSRCLFEIVTQFYKSKNLNTLLKSKFDNILAFYEKIHAELPYHPKRLKKRPSISDFILSLTQSIIAKRRGAHYIHKPI